MSRIKIVCYLSHGCASENMLRKNIEQALKFENMDAEIIFLRIDDSEANVLKLKGSPSIFINDVEIQPIDIEGFS